MQGTTMERSKLQALATELAKDMVAQRYFRRPSKMGGLPVYS